MFVFTKRTMFEYAPRDRPCVRQQELVEDYKGDRRRHRELRRHCVPCRIVFLHGYSTIRRVLGDHLDDDFGERKLQLCNPPLNSDTG